MVTVIFLAIGLMIVFVLLMSVGLFLKGKPIERTCASQNPLLANDDGTCSFCGQDVNSCENEGNKNLKVA